MESLNRWSNLENFPKMTRQALLPPVSPFPRVSSYTDCPMVGSQCIPKLEGPSYHQCRSSECFLPEEQPSWLEELLNEPETLMHRGHRRSSSDSLAYLTFNTREEHGLKSNIAEPSWASQNFPHHKKSWSGFTDTKPSSADKRHHWVNEPSLKSATCPSGLSSIKDGIAFQNSGSSSCAVPESDGSQSAAIQKCDQKESDSQSQEGAAERSCSIQAKPSVSKTDAKRAKQQSAHRSRIRKLQYIAELERSVQVLQAEGSEVSAELQFLNQQNLILGMENRALRRRLDSLSQEHLIKHLEQDMLEREIGRLKTLHQLHMMQQQQQQHRRARSRDLETQFAALSIQHKETGSSSSSVNGSVHI